jgi:glycosyltransferase involved in cell wall biosynthesis
MDKDNEKYNIVCFSNQLWDYPLWTNKKHVMTRLSEQGHNVLFIDPPINTGRLFLRQLLAGKWNMRRIFTWEYSDAKVKVVSPLNFLPFYDLLASLHTLIIRQRAQNLFDKSLKTLMWIYNVELPGIDRYVNGIEHDLLIYDCVDNYAGFPKYDTPEKKDAVNRQEERLTKRADIVFATAPGLVDKLRRFNVNVHYMPNVGDYDMFVKSRDGKDNLPEDLKSIPKPVIAFTGAIDEYKFDRGLMRKASLAFPNYSFVIIGPIALKDREGSLKELGLDDLNNVYFLGTKPYKEMPNYFAGFDVFVIPYQLNDYTVGGCFPVKFHEGLAAGLPVIVTNLPAYQPFEDVCYISKSHNEFIQNIRRALEEDNDSKIKERQIIAKENSWSGKVSNMLALIKKELDKK